MLKVLEDPDSLTEDEIHAIIRKGVCTNKINPVLCGTAFKTKEFNLFLMLSRVGCLLQLIEELSRDRLSI